MNTFSKVFVALVIFAAVGASIYGYSYRDTLMGKADSMELGATANDSQPEKGKDGEAMVQKDEPMMQKGGTYIPFSPEVLTNSATTRRVLFFYANWCPTCRPADASFTENVVQIPADVTLIRVNYNDTDTDLGEKNLAKQYDVTYQHTFVQIDDEGNEVTKWNGGQIGELLGNIK